VPEELLTSLFSDDDLSRVMVLNLLGVIALAGGIVTGSSSRSRVRAIASRPQGWLNAAARKRLYRTSLAFIGAAFVLYMFGLQNVGGFVAAYSKIKGGWTADSGYARDFVVLVIPGVTLLFMAKLDQRWKLHELAIPVIASFPLLVHGLLSGRRGPTFMMLVTLIAGWYLVRGKRPSVAQMSLGIPLGGALLLLLVSYRMEIYIGSDLFNTSRFSVDELTERVQGGDRFYGDEFIYGTEMVTNASLEEDYYWGRRILTILFIRPIPKEVWPTKYGDVGMESMLLNGGTNGTDLTSWGANPYVVLGSAPGLIADLYVEFSWLAVVVLFAIGWAYGMTWRKCVSRDVFGTLTYVLMMAFSIYLVCQTLGAFIAPFTAAFVPSLIAWLAYLQSYRSPVAITAPDVLIGDDYGR
jgi:oligosaccharide repeat unit polymerase